MSVLPSFPRNVVRSTVYLATVLLAACTVNIGADGAAQERSLMDRLPAGATAVAWIDVGGLAAVTPEESWDRYRRAFEADEDMQDLERFTEATGMDPRENIAQIAFAALPSDTAPDDYLVLISATFDRDKLEALADGADNVVYDGTTFYDAEDIFRKLGEAVGRRDETSADDGNGAPGAAAARRPGYVAILDAATLAMGSEESLRAAVDVGSGSREPITTDGVMTGFIGDVYDQGQIWFVALRGAWDKRVDELGLQPGGMPNQAIDGIEVVTMTVRMGDGMNMRIAALAADADAAAELVSSLNGLLAMGRMMVQQSDPQLFEILDRGLNVAQDERSVHLDIVLSDADIETLRRLAEEQMPDR